MTLWHGSRSALADHLLDHDGFLQVVTVNAELLLDARNDPAIRELLTAGDTLCTVDGVGAGLALNRDGSAEAPRITGVELTRELLGRGCRVYLLGAEEQVNRKVAERAERSGAEVAGRHHGYYDPGEEADIMREVAESEPDVLLVALGAPRQEKLIRAYREQLDGVTAIGVGGSFDVLAGASRRAPAVVASIGLEWLWRNLAPSRWHRLARVVRFGFLLLKLRFTGQALFPAEQ